MKYGKKWKERKCWRWDKDEERLKEEQKERGGSRRKRRVYEITEEEK